MEFTLDPEVSFEEAIVCIYATTTGLVRSSFISTLTSPLYYVQSRQLRGSTRYERAMNKCCTVVCIADSSIDDSVHGHMHTHVSGNIEKRQDICRFRQGASVLDAGIPVLWR